MNCPLFVTNRDVLKEKLNVDDCAITALSVEYDRNSNVSLLLKYPFLFHGLLSIVTNTIFPLLGIKRKLLFSEEEFIFVSCPDPVFRIKNINMITGDMNYSIIFQPNFHIKETILYHKYFKSNKIKTYFPTITLKHLVSAWRRIKCIKQSCCLSNDYSDNIRFLGVLSIFLIYDEVVKDYIRDLNGFNGKWILEHQIFYFVPVITNLRAKSIGATMLQHGLFFKPTDDFFPLHCDSVLCCSEREKRIYVQEGVSPNRVRVLGIPLQTIGSNENNDSDSLGPQYELLILLTYVDSNNSKLLGDVLDFVRNNYNNVLLRFRPRSKDNDIKLLQDHLEGFIISEGFDISYDISRSKRCITFSADAIVEVVKMKKPFVYIWLKEYLEFIQDIQCATMDNYKEHIQSLLEKDNYTSKMQSFATDMIGEQDVNILRERFIDYIRA